MKKIKSFLIFFMLCFGLCTCAACSVQPDKFAPGGEKCEDGLWICQEMDLILTNESTGMINTGGAEVEFCYMYDRGAEIVFFVRGDKRNEDGDYEDEWWFRASLSKCRKRGFVIYKDDVKNDEYGLFDNTDQLTFVLEEAE